MRLPLSRPSPRLAALALAALAAACGGDSKSSQSGIEPLVWTFVPVAGAVCSDGSPTGIGVERSPTPGANVLVFLMGGGACWDTLTCFPSPLLPQFATPGPYGSAQLQSDLALLRQGSILDRSLAANPYRDFTFVFVPYCTGDVHAGDAVQSYGPGTWHHKGRVNLAADFSWLAANVDAPAKVVVSGASAGGFGSLLAFKKAKATWPGAKAYLVDDSGPPLDAIPPSTIQGWLASWDLGTVLADVCGAPCAGPAPTMAPILPELAKAYPNDRFALLSSTRDQTIRFFFGTFTATFPLLVQMDGQTFEASLRRLADAIEDDTPPGETHAFVVAATSHTMLGNPSAFTSQGKNLLDWLSQQVNDDPAWSRAIPP